MNMQSGSLNRLWHATLTGFSLIHAALAEIFEESAYARFLARKRIRSSSQAYTIFLREQETAKSRRPRCC